MGAPRKYSCDFSFFKSIDTEDKAYWLGFIAADGYITTNHGNKRLCIVLNEKDKEHLEKFITAIGGNYPVNTYKNNGGYSANGNRVMICIPSTEMVDDLISYGIDFNKSLTLKFPQIDRDLVHHFIRGYFDGDGSISKIKYSKGKGKPKIYFKGIVNIVGTVNVLESICGLLPISFTKIPIYKENRCISGVYCLKLSSNIRVKLFYDYVYRNATICLKRKQDIFLSL